jgi:triacylglycerol esterase/lipase EstA (alpha/beta hydrolase family)
MIHLASVLDPIELTREGATDLNRKTSLNPNIVYKTYTGEATHKALNYLLISIN